ncbi:uncharacterized protein A1O9_12982 [Exophiala aquamarina CBS 119918]|uniref:3-oxoacyl-[acyl-carrier protein] reductase n=1 Tax=Exophiala aquamarina CBS 119918 TaxID=1182545 RepID=A0A072NSX2_9EURO|nr:uncharacterized protein A1O9_12982 [Exophiala aquamarina CBS 119918]KEF50964.1 hypothetical protein A1O9_12982 [Exophiala aquamarina CBS 119918]
MLDADIGSTWTFGTYAHQLMAKQEPRGSNGSRRNIFNIASGAGTRGVSRLAASCAMKHAVIGLARAWHQDFGKNNIRVHAVAPGGSVVLWSLGFSPSLIMLKARLQLQPTSSAYREAGFFELTPKNPLGRSAQPVEIGRAVAFLLSDEPSGVGSEILPVTGGYT